MSDSEVNLKNDNLFCKIQQNCESHKSYKLRVKYALQFNLNIKGGNLCNGKQLIASGKVLDINTHFHTNTKPICTLGETS